MCPSHKQIRSKSSLRNSSSQNIVRSKNFRFNRLLYVVHGEGGDRMKHQLYLGLVLSGCSTYGPIQPQVPGSQTQPSHVQPPVPQSATPDMQISPLQQPVQPPLQAQIVPQPVQAPVYPQTYPEQQPPIILRQPIIVPVPVGQQVPTPTPWQQSSYAPGFIPQPPPLLQPIIVRQRVITPVPQPVPYGVRQPIIYRQPPVIYPGPTIYRRPCC
jgi:hypothetical protein